MLGIYHNKIWQIRPWAKSDPLPALVNSLFWGDTATPTYLHMYMVAFALQGRVEYFKQRLHGLPSL